MKKLILTIAATLLMANAFAFGPGYKFQKQPIDDVPLTYEDICIQAELDELENNLPSYWRERACKSFCLSVLSMDMVLLIELSKTWCSILQNCL